MAEVQSCKRATLLLKEMHTPYIVHVCVPTAAVGRTTVTWRGHRGHTQESQAVAQLLHAEVTGVTQLSHTCVTDSRTSVTGRVHRGHREGGK